MASLLVGSARTARERLLRCWASLFPMGWGAPGSPHGCPATALQSVSPSWPCSQLQPSPATALSILPCLLLLVFFFSQPHPHSRPLWFTRLAPPGSARLHSSGRWLGCLHGWMSFWCWAALWLFSALLRAFVSIAGSGCVFLSFFASGSPVLGVHGFSTGLSC